MHPGGPFFAKKYEGWWTIPKGEPNVGEDLLECAVREFEEETAYRPQEPFTKLAPITQKGGKQVHCWAAQGELEAENITCNTFEIEWPPRSGKRASYPEVDKAGWFTKAEAKKLINERQGAFLEQFASIIKRKQR